MRSKAGIMLAAGGICFFASSLQGLADPLANSRPFFGWPSLVQEARKYIGTNPTDRDRLWCATFMNMILKKTGYAGTNSDAAKSFAQYGRRIAAPEVGAIAVLTRGKRGGHVGVVTGIDPHGNPIIISGNHNKRVGVAVYARSRVIAYVMPTEQRAVPSPLTAQAAVNRPGNEPAIDSPIAELLAAIQSEQDEAPRAAARPQVREAAPPQQRAAQPSSDQGGVSTPWGELFDAMENARAARDRRAEQVTPGRVVR
jgi:uncharacterized protein (TIGR02594 family)